MVFVGSRGNKSWAIISVLVHIAIVMWGTKVSKVLVLFTYKDIRLLPLLVLK